MTEPTKPADGGKKDDHPPKKGGGVWGAVGTTISVVVGLIVLFFILATLFPTMFGGLGSAVGAFGAGLASVGVQLIQVTMGLRMFGSGFFGLAMTALLYAILIIVPSYFGFLFIKKLVSGEGKKDH